MAQPYSSQSPYGSQSAIARDGFAQKQGILHKATSRPGSVVALVNIVAVFIVVVLLGVSVSTDTVWWHLKLQAGEFKVMLSELQQCPSSGRCAGYEYDSAMFQHPSDAKDWMKVQKSTADAAFSFVFIAFLVQLISYAFFVQMSNKLAVVLGYVFFAALTLGWILVIGSTFRFSGGVVSELVCKDIFSSENLLNLLSNICKDKYFAADETVSDQGGNSQSNSWGPKAGWNCSLVSFIFGFFMISAAILTLVRFSRVRAQEGDNGKTGGYHDNSSLVGYPNAGYNYHAESSGYNPPAPIFSASSYNPPPQHQAAYYPPPPPQSAYTSV
eukprot:ANDGO_04568.mRNA.1 hypothetical protein